jgi:hypothetical protein
MAAAQGREIVSEQPPPWNPQGPGQDQPTYPGEAYPPPGGQAPIGPYQQQPGWPQGQPPYFPPGGQPPYPGPGYGPPQQPPRRGSNSHWVRNILAGIGAVVVVSVVLSHLSSGNSSGSSTSPGQAAVAGSASVPASGSPPPPASPTPPPPTKVEFIVSGSAPDGIDITYGPGGTQLSGPSVLDGKATTSVAFDPGASYYALNAQLQGDGSITCKIVATGPGDNPLTVSHGAASGSYNICSAQAAPSDNGLSWQDEN